MSVLDLVRADLRDFAGYRSARAEALRGDVWLNANESAWANPADADAVCRRYPEPQPPALLAALSRLYGVPADRVLAGRGSDEAIDLLVRATCVPGRDAVLVTPPVFGMYAVSARLQGAPLLEVPLVDAEDGLVPDVAAIVDAIASQPVKLAFLCSPSNPGGSAIAQEHIITIAEAARGRTLVVVDEAYAEFSGVPSALALLDRYAHLVVLRTLSKAHALAAARIGVAIGDPALIDVLRRCQAPYPVPAPCATLAEAGLRESALQATRARIALVVRERERLRQALAAVAGVRRVYPSQANFLLVRFDDAQAAFDALLAAGVVVRDQRAAPGLGDALRITIGTPEQNDRVLAALDPHARGEVAGMGTAGAAA
jgi:histidinol-phosphate aminotransferase